ncbi:peptidoglycan-binding protein [Ramlibacter terrae]|uniref:Peptidoglycan-binding protein n=1 Tax=Ramlibacter terrae TaxID=2732511 RepID=A0ABX6P2F1_9BURK|nr:peptidoglycan-binding protein [Ramlibacter terrae]
MPHNKKSFLPATALLIPLLFAAPPVLLAQQATPAPAAAKQGGTYRQPLVAASIPVDPNEHMNELNADASMPVIGPGAKGPAVLRAQVLLDRAWFSPGEIDGAYGRNMRFATAAFQLARNLPQTGVVDAATGRRWRRWGRSRLSAPTC